MNTTIKRKPRKQLEEELRSVRKQLREQRRLVEIAEYKNRDAAADSAHLARWLNRLREEFCVDAKSTRRFEECAS